MQKLAVAFAGAALAATALSGSAHAVPVSGAVVNAATTLNVVDTVQYVYAGRRHCWYRNGWKGPGWYWCGYAWRRGYGWGGPVGWNGWAAPGVVVATPGVAVAAPGVVVTTGPYFYNGRYWHNRRWHRGRWVYW